MAASKRPRQFGTGALPPPGMEWIMGKTAASIHFVREAEELITASETSVGDEPLDVSDVALLRDAIVVVKSGVLKFDEETHPREWLERLKKEKHPTMGKGALIRNKPRRRKAR